MPKLIFVIPVVQLLILPWAANFDVKNINLKIADRDLSPLSTRLGQKLSASEYFTATFATDSYEDGFAGIEKGKTDIVLEIPKGFEKSLAAAGGAAGAYERQRNQRHKGGGSGLPTRTAS